MFPLEILQHEMSAAPTDVLLSLFLMLAVAKLFAEVFERLRQPAVVGEILGGIIIGPGILGWVSPTEITGTLAEIGVIFLLFTVGLETKPASILRVGKRAALVAVMGVVTPFLAGWLLMKFRGSSSIEALFLGTAMVATSVGITARVLSNLGVLDSLTGRIILGAAVIDDILGLTILGIVSGLSRGPLNYLSLALTLVLAVGFTAAVLLIGTPVVRRAAPRLENLRVSHALFVVALILCLGISVVAAYVGVAAIVGAFLAGMIFAEVVEERPALHRQFSGVTEFLVPFFLVNIGMQLRLDIFRDWSLVTFAIVVTIVAVITKLVGCGLAAWGLGLKRMGQIGMGMAPRGEVGIVVAQIGMGLGVVSETGFGVVLFMAIATTLIAPPFLRVLYRRDTKSAES